MKGAKGDIPGRGSRLREVQKGSFKYLELGQEDQREKEEAEQTQEADHKGLH